MIKFKIISNNDAQSEFIQLINYSMDKAKGSDGDISEDKNELQKLVKKYDEESEISKADYKLIQSYIAKLRNRYCNIKDIDVLSSLTMQVYEANILIKSFKFDKDLDCYVKKSFFEWLKSSVL